MKKKLLALMFTALSFVLFSCGEEITSSNEGAAGGIWIGEVYASAGAMPSAVEEEFESYSDCIEATSKAAASGIFSCGVK